MWTIPRISGAALAVVLLLSGCVPTPASTSPAPSPTATPVFASEAEALAAATKAYAAYSMASDGVTADGGDDPQRIAPFVSMEQLARELKGFAYLKDNSLSSVGQTKFDSVQIESYSGRSKSSFELSIYVCSDVSAIRLINAAGDDVTPVDLPNRSPLSVGFELGTAPQGELIVSRSDSWTGRNFCS